MGIVVYAAVNVGDAVRLVGLAGSELAVPHRRVLWCFACCGQTAKELRCCLG